MLYERIIHSSYIYQHIIENMHDGVLTVDNFGTITTVNSAAENILEIQKGDLLGKNYSDIFVSNFENDDFNQTVLDAVYESSMSHHKICSYFTGNNMKSLFVTTSFLRISYDNKNATVGVTIVFSDITELQELRDTAEAMDKIKNLNKQLAHLSCLDDLTGLYNRRYFNDVRDREWRRAIRENTFISMILLDIDNLKKLNDTYGHQAGDDCLKTVASALNNSLRRPSDFAARYGGDEFAVLLPRTDQSGAGMIAENMRLAVENLNIINPDSPRGIITISLGIACQKPTPDGHPENLVSAADEALYRVKLNGRNSVSI